MSSIRSVRLDGGSSLPQLRSMDLPNTLDPETQNQVSLVQDFMKKLSNQIQQPSERYINPYEEYSNPMQYPGFEQLPQEEKLNRLSFSQFDPANQTPSGQVVPPGSYEQPATRMAYEGAAFGALPVSPFKQPGMVSGALNALTRMLSGAGVQTGFQMLNPENQQGFMPALSENLKTQALIEGATTPFRALGYGANLINPKNVVEHEMTQMQNQYQSAKNMQDLHYNHPSILKHNDKIVTSTPKTFLDRIGIERRKLKPEARDLYDNFYKNPTFQNLQRFQARVNADAISLPQATKPYTKEAMKKWGKELKTETRSYIRSDKEAFQHYNEGDRLTRDIIKPFETTPELEKIVLGKKIKDVSPKQLSNFISSALEKKSSKIPEGHYLNESLKNINKSLNKAELLKGIIPEKWRGYIWDVPGVIQNPIISNVFRRSEYPYYLGSRMYNTEQNR